jgi:hypothetical protein
MLDESGPASWPGIDLQALESAGFHYEIVAGCLRVLPPGAVLSYAEAGIPAYWLIEQGTAGPIVHVYQLPAGQASYAEVATVRPGRTHRVELPFPIDICPDQLFGQR